MPECAVFFTPVCIEAFANLRRRALIAVIFRFRIEKDEEISRHHGIQVIEAVLELGRPTQGGIYPTFDEVVRGISRALVNEVFGIEEEPTLVGPGTKLS